MSSVKRAGSIVGVMVPRKNTGANDPTTIAVNFSHRLCVDFVTAALRSKCLATVSGARRKTITLQVGVLRSTSL
jgi:hypothetical protein